MHSTKKSNRRIPTTLVEKKKTMTLSRLFRSSTHLLRLTTRSRPTSLFRYKQLTLLPSFSKRMASDAGKHSLTADDAKKGAWVREETSLVEID